jgi:hypothetical protein
MATTANLHVVGGTSKGSGISGRSCRSYSCCSSVGRGRASRGVESVTDSPLRVEGALAMLRCTPQI